MTQMTGYTPKQLVIIYTPGQDIVLYIVCLMKVALAEAPIAWHVPHMFITGSPIYLFLVVAHFMAFLFFLSKKKVKAINHPSQAKSPSPSLYVIYCIIEAQCMNIAGEHPELWVPVH